MFKRSLWVLHILEQVLLLWVKAWPSWPEILGCIVCIHGQTGSQAPDPTYAWISQCGTSCGQTFECSPCVVIISFRKDSVANGGKLSGRTVLSTSPADLHTCICWTRSQVSMGFKGCGIGAFSSLSLLSKLWLCYQLSDSWDGSVTLRDANFQGLLFIFLLQPLDFFPYLQQTWGKK